MKELDLGTYLLFTHGGLICTQSYPLGIKDMISNCSVLGLKVNKNENLRR
jgi:hypothetical protein